MHLHAATARAGCIILELDLFGPSVPGGSGMHPEGMDAAELLQLMNVQGLLRKGGEAVSIKVRGSGVPIFPMPL